jgi:hypothetical protein
VIVRYIGDSTFAPSVSEAVISVAKTTPTLAISSNREAVAPGNQVTLTAAVAPPLQAATPTGTVQFLDAVNGAQPLPFGPARSIPFHVFSDGTPGLVAIPAVLSAGTHVFTAMYSGDLNYEPVPLSNPITIDATSATNTVVILNSGANPSVYRQPVTFTATVTAQSATGTPTGKVIFYLGNTPWRAVTLTAGQALFTTSELPPGSYSIQAIYSGDTKFLVNRSTPLTQIVRRADTSTAIALTSGANPTYGQQLNFTVTVSPPPFGGSPTGPVALYDGDALLASATLAGGQTAVFSTILSAGTHAIKAVYGGDANFADSASPVLNLAISPAPLVVTANNKSRLYGTPNPLLDGVVAGVVNGDDISVTYSTTATPSSPVGDYPIVPALTGAALSNYTATLNNGVLHVRNLVIAIEEVTGKPRFEHMALRITVTGIAATPTGTVTVREDTRVLGGGTLDSGNLVVDINMIRLGKHVITFDYSGDGNYGAVTSDPVIFYRSPKPH